MDYIEAFNNLHYPATKANPNGVPPYAATPEAVFVSMIDNLGSKVGMVQRALRQTGEAEEFSKRLPSLNSSLLVTKPGSPQD